MDSIGLFLFFILIIVLLIAVVNDIRFRKIPNWLTYPTILIAVACHTSLKGVDGFLFSLGGIGLGIGVLIVPYLVGAIGAGDTKFMGAIGGLLGPDGTFLTLLFSAMIGGMFALLFLTIDRGFKELATKYEKALSLFFFKLKENPISSPHGEKETRLCYGMAIGLGAVFSVVWRWTL